MSRLVGSRGPGRERRAGDGGRAWRQVPTLSRADTSTLTAAAYEAGRHAWL